MTPAEINALGVILAGLRDDGETAAVVSVAAHGPDYDMPDGCVGATVRAGAHEASARAKYLFDAICLARGKLRREAEARAKKAESVRVAETRS